ncbi:adenylate kinase [Gemmatimonas sp.]|uniref:adenylate kinase n=1 Tax=Gemmatimonas sp. TaxID=1962908 RepID=UPI0027BAE8BC|nr:adenylate kinase [Gemmatimonas sp.]
MIIVLLGPPGAGKGTQGERLAARLDVPKIATGDVLRAAVREGTPLGLEAKAAMDRGDLVPDAVIMGIMKEALASPMAARGAILDGVVRTTPQAEGLAGTLATLGRSLDAVLLFEVDEDELVRRLSGRTTCDVCQRPFFGRAPGETCTEGGQTGTLVRRKDDEPDAIRKRMQVYQDQTSPVIDWYASHGANMVRVDALGTLEHVEARVHAALGISR